MEPNEKKEIEETSTDAAESLEELLAHEPYVYQGKVYSRKRLYRGSSARMLIVGGYLAFMLVVVGGVVAWTYGVNFTLPSFILGVNEADSSPTVRVPVRVPPASTTVDVAATTTVDTQATSTLSIATSTSATTDMVASSTMATTTHTTSTSTVSVTEHIISTSTTTQP